MREPELAKIDEGKVEWGVVLDERGSTDYYYPEAEARQVAAQTGCQLVKITTVKVSQQGTATSDTSRVNSPQLIDTVEQLNALPIWSVIVLAETGIAFQKYWEGQWRGTNTADIAADDLDALDELLPVKLVSDGTPLVFVAPADCVLCADDQRVRGEIAFYAPTFTVCEDCGNKRCPRATYHVHECTGSNEAGQTGSRYGEMRCGVADCRCATVADALARSVADLISELGGRIEDFRPE